MITELEVKYFRNLDYLHLFLTKTSIMNGANGIGKSNALNSVNWLITNTLLTDKWGAGENDLNSVFNKNYIKGQDPSVKITLSSGITYEKKFKKGKDGNTAEFYVNGVKQKSKKEFEDSLYKNFNFEKKLKVSKDVNEIRLFTDALYALQKLDAKALRSLLIELGCSVTNDEVFESNPEFEMLKSYAPKYENDYTKMRTALKADRLEMNKQFESIPFMLEQAAGEEFNPEVRKELEKQKQELLNKINNFSNTSDGSAEYKKELAELKHQKELYITTESSKIMAKLAILEEKKKTAENNASQAQNEATAAINSKIQIKAQELSALQSSKLLYSTTRTNCRSEFEELQNSMKKLAEQAMQNEKLLDQVSKREFKGYVECPKCGHVFAGDHDALVLFTKQKQDDIANLNLTLSNIEVSLKEKEKQLDEVADKGVEAKANEEKVDKQIEEVKKAIDDLNNEIEEVKKQPVDLSKVQEIEAQILEVKNTKIAAPELDAKISVLTQKVMDLESGSIDEFKNELDILNANLEDLEFKIKEQYELESKSNMRDELKKKQTVLTKKINDIDYLIELTNKFIQTKIKFINNKAKQITGLDFVMLEDNISNDGVKEVCYATVDGVEFGNVNTSQKLTVGIKFIEKLKQILGSNDLPILADRLEGFDDIEKIKGLTTEQLICTVVGNKNQKEIVII